MAMAHRTAGLETRTVHGDGSCEHSVARAKNQASCTGLARVRLRELAIEERLHSTRAARMPFQRLIATIEENELRLDRFRWVDENRPIREWR